MIFKFNKDYEKGLVCFENRTHKGIETLKCLNHDVMENLCMITNRIAWPFLFDDFTRAKGKLHLVCQN